LNVVMESIWAAGWSVSFGMGSGRTSCLKLRNPPATTRKRVETRVNASEVGPSSVPPILHPSHPTQIPIDIFNSTPKSFVNPALVQSASSPFSLHTSIPRSDDNSLTAVVRVQRFLPSRRTRLAYLPTTSVSANNKPGFSRPPYQVQFPDSFRAVQNESQPLCSPNARKYKIWVPKVGVHWVELPVSTNLNSGTCWRCWWRWLET